MSERPSERRWRDRLLRIALQKRRRERRSGEWLEPGSDESMERGVLLRIWNEYEHRRRG